MSGLPMDVKLVHAATSNKLRSGILRKLMEGDLNIATLKNFFNLDEQMLNYHLALLERARLIAIAEKAGVKIVSLSPVGRMYMEGKSSKPIALKQGVKQVQVELAAVKQLIPCIADSSKLRVIAELVPPLDKSLKIVKSAFKGARYSDKLNVLLFQRGTKLFTIYSTGKLTITMVEDQAEALQLLEEIKSKINEALGRGITEGERELEQKLAISALEVYKYLPRIDCKRCNEQSCYAFAVKLLNGEVKLNKCEPLREEKYAVHREHLATLLMFNNSYV
jgi:ArsR family metal-binding transcriptional regulator